MGPLVLRVENALLKKHLKRQASRLGLEFGEFTDEKLESPKMLVAELEQPELLKEVTDWKEKWPECFVAISVSEPNRELWIAAETAGENSQLPRKQGCGLSIYNGQIFTGNTVNTHI